MADEKISAMTPGGAVIGTDKLPIERAGANLTILASTLLTDTTNVTAAGALMDSEIASLADVKAINQSLVSGAAPTLVGTNLSGVAASLTVGATTGVEAGATADQTNTEIRTAIGAATDSNIFTDALITALNAAPVISSGAGAPISTPSAVGDIYIDTTGDIAYSATGTVSSADWKQTSGGGGGDLLAANNLSDVANAGTARTNLGVAIGSNVQAHSAVLDGTTASFLTADETKLDAITGTNTGDEAAASLTVAGVVELATVAETDTGTDATRALTPAGLAGSALQTKVDGISGSNTGDEAAASATVSGTVELATVPETDTGTDATRALTPAGLKGSALQIHADTIEGGADVTDGTNVAAAGATMDADTSVAGNGYFLDDDTMAGNDATKVVSQQSLVAYLAAEIAAAITSGMHYKGAYNAATNTPDLDTSPIAAEIGDVYAVTVAGTFFTVVVEIGDMLIANQGTPTLEAHWDVVQANMTAASTKTLYESNADTNEFSDALLTKLNNIETAATIDQTDAEIRTAVEAATDSNVFTDADHTALNAAPITSSGVGAPSSTPATVGDIYVDTAGDISYSATGTVSSADWKQTTGGGGGDLLASNNLSDVSNAGTARTNLGVAIGSDVQAYAAALDAVTGTNTGDEVAASLTVAGKVELATVAETDTGSDATRALTPAGLAGSALQTKVDGIEAGAEVNPAVVSQGDAEAGIATDERIWTAVRVAQAIAALASGAAPVDVQVFSSSATWTKPAGAVLVTVEVVSGGGGGGSGRKGTLDASSGGGGGSAGSQNKVTMPASAFGATCGLIVGAGGTGGVAQTVDATNGNDGTKGGISSFDISSEITLINSTSGADNGSGGGTASGSGGSDTYYYNMDSGFIDPSIAQTGGGGGQDSPFTGGAGELRPSMGPTGGGGGAEENEAGGVGGSFSANALANTITGIPAAADVNGVTFQNYGMGGGGASGGGGVAGVKGADGGAGGGGGGGGSGGRTATHDSGAGGDGGDGVVIVTTFF